MNDPRATPESAAFDAIARDYDAAFSHSATGRLLRDRVRSLLQGMTGESPRVLELNCGTGEDAIWLAKRGCRVLATDISPAMIAVTRQKAKATGLENHIDTAVCAMERIAALPAATLPFDLILSNFGGLNCVSPDALRRLNDDLLPLLPAEGIFAAVVMSRFCWWETLYFLLKGKPGAAFRRLKRGPVAARLDADTTVPTRYYSPRAFRRLFPGFRVISTSPAGFWLPPSYLDPFFAKYPTALRVLNVLEKHCCPGWLSPASDHFFILLKKRNRHNQAYESGT